MKNWTILILFSIAMLLTSCEKDPEEGNDEEVITTVIYTLTNTLDAGDVVTLTFRDLDGDAGGNDPVITGGTLAANSTYSGSIRLSNETEDPAEDITEEIEEEDDEHQFFFTSTVPDLAVAYADEDEGEKPVGLSTTVSTGDAATGNLTVTLVHEPEKDEAGVSDGDITNAGGEIDIEVTYPVDVQ